MKNLNIYFLSLVLLISFNLDASKYDKESASDLYKKATKHLKEEDYKSALKTLKKYTKSKKKDADGWTLLAFTNRKLKNYSEAESLYIKALNLDPDNKVAIEYQGELFVELGRLEEANANLAKLKALCPNSCEELEMLEEYISGSKTKSW
jgi:Flp pilus assembly protein TadD